ncbi:MAG: hypothetical protein WCP61_08805 [Chitinophagia bacterium]
MITNYNQLSIKQFLACKRISEMEQDPIMRKVKMLAEISGRSEDEIEDLPISELKKQLEEFNQIETLTGNKKVKMKFKVGGRRFEVIWKQQELTASQFIDSTFFTKESTEIVNQIHNILAAICVERTWYGKRKAYDGSKHKEIADLFYNEMKIATAYPIMLFFCKYFEALQENIETCLMEELKAMNKTIQEHLIKSGVGLQQ